MNLEKNINIFFYITSQLKIERTKLTAFNINLLKALKILDFFLFLICKNPLSKNK